MKIQNLIVAASLALVPVTAMADEDKKEALKKAKAEALKKKLEEAKAKAAAKAEVKETKSEVRKVKQDEAKAAADDAAAKAAEEEKTMHAQNLGKIERISQVAEATNNADLKALVAKLNEKEAKRHALAAPPATGG